MGCLILFLIFVEEKYDASSSNPALISSKFWKLFLTCVLLNYLSKFFGRKGS